MEHSIIERGAVTATRERRQQRSGQNGSPLIRLACSSVTVCFSATGTGSAEASWKHPPPDCIYTKAQLRSWPGLTLFQPLKENSPARRARMAPGTGWSPRCELWPPRHRNAKMPDMPGNGNTLAFACSALSSASSDSIRAIAWVVDGVQAGRGEAPWLQQLR